MSETVIPTHSHTFPAIEICLLTEVLPSLNQAAFQVPLPARFSHLTFIVTYQAASAALANVSAAK